MFIYFTREHFTSLLDRQTDRKTCFGTIKHLTAKHFGKLTIRLKVDIPLYRQTESKIDG